MLRVGGSGEVGELEKFFDGGKYGRDWVSKMVHNLLDDVLELKEFMWHQLTVVLLALSENVRHGIVDGVCHAILDIREIIFLDCGDDMLHKALLNSYNFAKKTHFLGVCNYYVWVYVDGCTVRDDEWNRVSQVYKGIFRYEYKLRIS